MMDQSTTLRGVGDDDFFYEEVEEKNARTRLDIAAISAILRRNWWLILGSVAVALLLALAITAFMTPKFTATSSVQIEQQTTRILEGEDVEPAVEGTDADRHLTTQVDILKSRAMAIRVANSLKLFSNSSFLEQMGARSPEATPAGAPDAEARREAVLGQLAQNLEVSLPRQSRVVRISFTSPDPQWSSRIANSYAENLITSNLQRRYDSSSYAREFLQTQLNDARARLEQSERELNNYARSAALIRTGSATGSNTSVGTTGSITTDSLVQLNQALGSAQSQRIRAEQRWRAANSASLLTLPEVTSNSAVQQLLQQRSEQLSALSEARQRHREEHPSIRAATARVVELDRQITRLAQNIRAGVAEEYRIAAGQEAALLSRVNSLKGDTLSEQDRSVRFNILSRGVDTNRALYEGLLQRFREVSTAAGVSTNNISIIDRAHPPSGASSPNLMLNLLLGFLAGCALGVMLVFARERIDDTVRTPEDVERKLSLPALGVIPLVPKDEDIVVAMQTPKSPVSEAYAALRTSLFFSTAEGLPASLLVTSSQPGEGKSTTAVGLAANLARLGKSTLLIDADLRRPSLHRSLGVANDQGLSNVLTGQAPLESAIKTDLFDKFALLTSGPLPPNPAELLGQRQLRELISEALKKFECIVIDCPPVLGLADAPMLAADAAATIFVLEAGLNHRGRAKAAIRRLRMTNSHLIGVVLTKLDPKKGGLGGYYGYDYYSYHSEAETPGAA